jgi:DNA-binding CsgD family transcriptional regulator/PAS domain-containing protein
MEAVQAAVLASGMSELADVQRQLSECLDLLSAAMGASRACLCFFGSDGEGDVVERFHTGGARSVRPVGPLLQGVSLRLVPELAPMFADGGGCVVIETDKASAAFREIFHGSGLPPVANGVSCTALRTISEAIRPMAKTLPTLRDVHTVNEAVLQMLDSAGMSLVVLDRSARVVSVNDAGAQLLGATTEQLRHRLAASRDWDVRTSDGLPVPLRAISGVLGSPVDWDRPHDYQFRNCAGRLVRARLWLKACESSDGPQRGHIVAVVKELPGTATVNPPVHLDDVDPKAQLSDVLARLNMALSELEGIRAVRPPVRELPAVFDLLSSRESEVVSLLLDGVRVSTIAERLYLSPHTVRNHLRAIFRKLQVRSQAELIRLARGLV